MTPNAIEFTQVDPDGEVASRLLQRYYNELNARFEEGFDVDSSKPTPTDEFRAPHGTFLVARIDELPVGCGAIRRLDDTTGEIKRMWLDPSIRGKGLGRQMLAALESVARELGYTSLCLDTSRFLSEAISLYRSSGYEDVAAYNDNPHADLWFLKQDL